MNQNNSINRYAAIDAVDKRIAELNNDPEFRRKNVGVDLYGVKKLILDLPTTDKYGEWIKIPHRHNLPWDCEPCHGEEDYDEETHSIRVYYWHCSNCKYEADRNFRPLWKYCPNCGARMIKDE